MASETFYTQEEYDKMHEEYCKEKAKELIVNLREPLVVGDRVEDIFFCKGMTGTVIEVYPWDINDLPSDHGFVTVKLDAHCVGKFNCSPPDEEHYSHVNWYKCLKKI